MSFGIALPSWIVEKENSVLVLGVYGLIFMVALPTIVGMWWYKSIRYTGDQVISIFVAEKIFVYMPIINYMYMDYILLYNLRLGSLGNN